MHWTSLSVSTSNLIAILELFSPDQEFEKLEFVDTWHPSGGFIDEGMLPKPGKVGDLLALEYEFKGLVMFEAVIDSIAIRLSRSTQIVSPQEVFEIEGKLDDLAGILVKLEEANESMPGKYYFRYETFWKG